MTMSPDSSNQSNIAIACGGTGGHLFPGLAVAEFLRAQGCRIILLISPKEVDQEAVRRASGMEVVTLPAVGLTRGRFLAFAAGSVRSYRASLKAFNSSTPAAVLAMGGFTSAPPLLAGKRLGARTFLHESNSVPGRANRWLSRVVDHAFISFPGAADRLHASCVSVSGTPVRNSFRGLEAGPCRAALGLDPASPVVLVTGGSQGASGVNSLVINALPRLAVSVPGAQWIHLAGSRDAERVRDAYARVNLRAMVLPFFDRMDLALGAATVAVSRAGASSLAEITAVRLPSVLIPYPAATDDHQLCNARAFTDSGAAVLLEQSGASADALHDALVPLIVDTRKRNAMSAALAGWDAPEAAVRIGSAILDSISLNRQPGTSRASADCNLPNRHSALA
jgi:UDP-N-acetylglucosamine--N-acetylmuramyl-(pentapeptide) pyrophosphoryl-undecaprenol N-acetylglucosamine transferase